MSDCCIDVEFVTDSIEVEFSEETTLVTFDAPLPASNYLGLIPTRSAVPTPNSSSVQIFNLSSTDEIYLQWPDGTLKMIAIK